MLGARSSKLSVANRELARANAVLSVQREYAEAIVSTVPSGLLVIAGDGTIETVNSRCATLFRTTPEAAVGRRAGDVLPTVVVALVRSAARTGEPVSNVVLPDLGGRGSKRFLEVGVHQMPTDGDSGRRLLVTVTDVTKRCLADEQLRQAQKLESIGQLAAGIAHEINTPIQYVADNMRFLRQAVGELAPALQAIQELARQVDLPSAFSEAVRGSSPSDLGFLLREIPDAVEESLSGVERVAEIVSAMKTFSHPGGRPPSPVDINQALEDSLVVSRNEWKYVADVETSFAPDLPRVPGYTAELNQVFLNLLVNAAHAVAPTNETRKRGTIDLTTRQDGDWVEIRIRDSGSGIASDVMPRIFDPFFTTKEVGRGTGQGLALAHSIVVKKHQGMISVDSKVGVGSTFIVRLPILPPASKGAQ